MPFYAQYYINNIGVITMENKNPFKNIQDKVFDMEHRIINNIYVDMELLQDLSIPNGVGIEIKA